MSRDQKKRLLITVGAFTSAVLGVSAITAPSVRLVDARYVHKSTFDTLVIRQQSREAIDSLKHDKEIADIQRSMAQIDTGVRCLRHALPRRDCEK